MDKQETMLVALSRAELEILRTSLDTALGEATSLRMEQEILPVRQHIEHCLAGWDRSDEIRALSD